MKIALVLSDVSYPPQEGLHQQSTLLAAELSHLGHEVSVFTYGRSEHLAKDAFERDADVRVWLPSHRVRQGALLGSILSCIPGTPAFKAQREFSQQLREMAIDVVHAEGALASMLPLRNIDAKRSVLSWVDLGSARYSRLASHSAGLSKLRYAIARAAYSVLEARASKRWRTWHFVSSVDATASSRVYRDVASTAIPPMVPRRFFERARSPRTDRVVVFADLRQEYLRDSFMAHMTQIATHSDEFAHVEFTVLGRVRSVEDLELPTWANVHYLEWADDYVEELATAGVVFLPDSTGSGIKNRFLQSLALGAPVVASPAAAEGTVAEDGLHFLEISDVHAFPTVLNHALVDASLRSQLSRHARSFAAATFHPESVTRSWIELYEGVTLE